MNDRSCVEPDVPALSQTKSLAKVRNHALNLGFGQAAFIAGLPFDIAEREIACVRKSFDWPDRSFAVRELPEEQGPGNILLLEAEYEHVTEVVSGFGQLGVPA